MAKRKGASQSAAGGVFLVSLGCPKNFVDTEVMAGGLVSSGIRLTFDQEEADTVLINTCAFIPEARDETVDAIMEAIDWKAAGSGRRVVVTGCLIQWDKDQEFRSEFPEVDLWCGVDEVPHLAERLRELRRSPAGALPEVFSCAEPAYLYDETTPRLQLTLPHLAYLKIADGCDNRCSYCSIPNIRGSLRSRSIGSAVAEAENLRRNGVRELIVIAQDVTAFGHDRQDGTTLAGLLRELDRLPGKFWIRLLYTHPAHFTDELIEVLASSNHVLPYLDIPLQHIDDGILRRMGRKVTRGQVEMLLSRLRQAIPELTLRTTFITGFPGEGDREYEALKEFVGRMKFERLGVFAYSPEPNTPAADFPEQVDLEVAERRAAELLDLQQALSQRYNESWVGRELEVLVDAVEGCRATARSRMDAPEIDNIVTVKASRELRPGGFYKVRITGGDEFDLTAEL